MEGKKRIQMKQMTSYFHFIQATPHPQLTPALPFSLSALANGYLPWWKGYSVLKEEKRNSSYEEKEERENKGVDERGGEKKAEKYFI